jgi:O-antigen ligase
MRPERLSKSAIALWALGAILIELYYASPGWAALRIVGPLALGGGAIAARLAPSLVGVVAAAPYLFPAVLYLTTGQYHVHYTVAWLAALLGFVLPDALTRPWNAPARWSVPLACWAGVVAVTTPIVVLRSADFHFELLTRGRLPHESLGGLTFSGIAWTGHVALVLVVGVLWFDWLLSRDRQRFAARVLVPMACSALVMAGVAAYQMRDLDYVNPTMFAAMGRATGTLFDANVTGAALACWIGGWTALAAARGPMLRRMLPAIVALLWAGVWATSSRTAFATALVVSAVALWTVLRARIDRRLALGAVAVALAVLALAAALVVSRWHTAAVGPIERFASMGTQLFTAEGLRQVLWDRDGYGLVANAMLAQHPFFGVGVGMFHGLVGQYTSGLIADNAQNWYRHQLAELGVVGSLGWIVFVASFAWWVIRSHRGASPGTAVVRMILIVLALISLVGMPTQDPALAITFWTMAAWFVQLVGMPEAAAAPASRRAWTAAVTVVGVAAVGTLAAARGSLRPPRLAQSASVDAYGEYVYGFWPPEGSADDPFRWVGRRGTIVVPVSGRQFTLTLAANLPDLASRPVHVKAWVDGRTIVDSELTIESPVVEKTLILPAGERRVLVETASDRSATAPRPDGRDLALQVRWRFAPLR